MLKIGLWEEINLDLDGPARFIMVEFPVTNIPKDPMSLKFVNRIRKKCRIVLDTPLD